MINFDIIEPSNSPFCSPMLLVVKLDGTVRPVIDYRRLNKITVFDAEPIPNPDEILYKLTSSCFFSKLDFCSGYWQIAMCDADKHKTAFGTTKGLFQFKRMPFGLTNAGATYTRMMRLLLADVKNVDNYIDDVLIHTQSWGDHLHALRAVFVRVRNSRMTVKPSKCYMGYGSVEFLGHSIEKGLLLTQVDKTEKISEAPIPFTKTQVRSFLGLTGYYQKFIPNYARLTAPLSDLTKKGKPETVVWTPVAEDAFTLLKRMLCDQPVLHLPDFDRPFILRTDASNVGLGPVFVRLSSFL